MVSKLDDIMGEGGFEDFREQIAYKPLYKKKTQLPIQYSRRADFYDLAEWKALRIKVLREYGNECMRCGLTDRAMQVDHIKARSRYPGLSLDFNNLQVLCQECNERKGTRTVDYRARKYLK